ncbi:MAG: hypothetical protein LF885_05965 [Rickettsia endosymbiont of Culicoides impunctatus]|uniref:DUF6980 family protein n=1 Tax=unclassified Candidatus Tisiphia TaxID=2996318 RepID=UPI001E76BCEF|nr:MAG: hypothetical protein LF885_05965 [Rickettsia endosymbiont of Culicoides impunctatus]
MKFCCKDFPSKQNGRAITFYCERTEDSIINYYPRERDYLTIHGEATGYSIQYCPWCGTKLPRELWDEWYDILSSEYGIEDPTENDREKVPAEFWTDEWWKKRGL